MFKQEFNMYIRKKDQVSKVQLFNLKMIKDFWTR